MTWVEKMEKKRERKGEQSQKKKKGDQSQKNRKGKNNGNLLVTSFSYLQSYM